MTVSITFATVAHIALVLAVATVLLVSPLLVLFTPAFVRYEYGHPGFPPSMRFANAERLRISDAIMAYIRGSQSREQLAAVVTDGGDVALREREVDHLADVKVVVDGFFAACAIAWIVGLLSVALIWLSPLRRDLPKYVRQGAWVMVALMLLILMASFIDFNVFFTKFHEIFFSDDTWTFYLEDTLIQLYPLPFWVDTVQKLGIAVLAGTALAFVFSLILGRLSVFAGSPK